MHTISRVSMLVVLCVHGTVHAADWPMYRGDAAHSGATAELLPSTLRQAWIYSAPAKPKTGLPGDEGRTVEGHVLVSRVKFDDCLHAVSAGGRVYFGSSVDHQVRCLDAETGKELWTFFTDGPVRLAPCVAGNRIFFGSDDGHAYCLDAKSGAMVWKLRAGPHDERLLARGEMISRWPVRTSVLVDNGVAYFGAGVFPHETVYLYAVRAEDGKVVWVRDNISQMDAGRDDLSPQGYLLAAGDLLFVPSGRSLPAAVDRRTGGILHKRVHAWRSTAGGVIGGTEALLADGQIYSSGAHHFLAMDQRTGDVGFGYFDGHQMATAGDAAFVATGHRLSRLDRLTNAAGSRQRQELELEVYGLTRKLRDLSPDEQQLKAQLSAAQEKLAGFADQGVTWSVESPHDAALIVAGNAVIAGGKNAVAAYNALTGERLWDAEVEGDARGLAVANGRLLVSTTTGNIYCFADGGTSAEVAAAAPSAEPYPRDDLTERYAEAAEAILDRTGITRGFCLVAGSEEGRLAYELAKRSQLTILGVEPNQAKADAARRALSAAGLYGHRVTIHHGDLADVPYSNYFANLIVSDSLLLGGEPAFDPASVVRHLKPVGGVLCLGRPATSSGGSLQSEKLTAWLEASGLKDQAKISTDGAWGMLVRGPLPGAGSWTHQYGDPGNTASSDDRLVKGGLGVLWFGDPGPNTMVNRHDGAVGPLTVNGRLFVQGEHKIMAYDAYNGLFLWEYENPEANRTGVFNNVNPGNVAAGPDSVFMFTGQVCEEIDAATGKLRRQHRLPTAVDGAAYQWGYVAYQDGLLFGTATIRTEVAEQLRRRGRKTDDFTDTIFAIDVATGKHAWAHQGTSISHHTVAIGPGRVYFIDSSITSEVRETILRQDKAALKDLPPDEAQKAEERMKRLDVRMAVALDSKTGRQLWMLPVDVTDCSEIGIGGGKLTLMYDQGVLLLCGANANGHYWSQFVAGDFSRRRLVALSADGGGLLWAKDANYRHRPIIVGDRVIAEPWAFNLYNGEQQTRPNVVTQQPEPWSIMRTGHHCGMITGCENMLFFRSGFTGYYDLTGDTGAQHFAGHRLGCWINAIPANGLVMIPEAGAGCVCMFSIESTIVLEPREPRRPWAIYSAVGELTPVKHLAVNLGAPGDRRDAHGRLWVTYPRPKPYRETSLELKLNVKTTFAEGGGFESVNEDSHAIARAEVPWIYTSSARGLTECSLPLRGTNDPPAQYTVKLYFTDLEHAEPGKRVFHIDLQGRRVESDLDIAAASGGRGRALVREYRGVEVAGDLNLRLVPRPGETSLSALPTLSAIEVSLASEASSGASDARP